MSDPIVTYADLSTLRALRDDASCDATGTDALLDRLIEAAEADRPPLPEGWVLFTDPEDGSQAVYWHADGMLWGHNDKVGRRGRAYHQREHLSPLRPTITEADLQAARQTLPLGTSRDMVRAAFAAAGIEVRS